MQYLKTDTVFNALLLSVGMFPDETYRDGMQTNSGRDYRGRFVRGNRYQIVRTVCHRYGKTVWYRDGRRLDICAA